MKRRKLWQWLRGWLCARRRAGWDWPMEIDSHKRETKMEMRRRLSDRHE